MHFAIDAHAGTERRGKGFPYIVHPMEAVSIVASMSNDQELLAAAALHDVVEDTQITLEEIEAAFGARVASFVKAETDVPITGNGEENTWRLRKQAAMDRLAAASYEAKMVALGDKLSNMRAIAADYRDQGDSLWNIFHAPGGKADHEWHYRGLAASLFDLADRKAYQEFVRLIDETFGEEDCSQPAPIRLEDYTYSGEGYTAMSYDHRDGYRMVKLYNDFMPREVAVQELQTARNVLKMGIPCPMPGRLVTDGKRIGTEFFRLRGKESYARAVSNHPEDLEKYALRFGEICRRLHQTECRIQFFPPVENSFRRMVEESVFFNEEEKRCMHRFMDRVPARTTCVHGDLHMGNLLTTPEEDYWIDLADFSWGNPYYDLGLLYIVTHCNPEELCQREFHISNAQMRAFWGHFMRAYFQTENAGILSAHETEILPFAALRMLGWTNLDHAIRPEWRQFIEKNLLKNPTL